MNRMLFVGLTIMSLWTTCVVAETGAFFNVSTLGAQLTINTIANPAHPHQRYSSAGIVTHTPGFSLANDNCVLSGTGYCLFPVSDNDSNTTYTTTISGPTGTFDITLCLNGKGPFTCADYHVIGNRFAYLGSATTNNMIEVCPMNPSTGDIATNACLPYVVPNTDSFIHGIALNPTGNRAYVSLFSANQVELCSVDTTTGALSNCNPTGFSSDSNTTPFAFTFPADLVVNTTGTFAYIANQASALDLVRGIIQCRIDDSTGELISCHSFSTSSTSGSSITAPGYMAINRTGNYIYVTDGSAGPGFGTFKCTANPTTGTITSCTETGAPAVYGTFWSAPVGVALSPSGRFAYVFDNTLGSIFYCAIDATTGELSNCAINQTAACMNFQDNNQDGYGLAINATGTEAYVVSVDNGILNAHIGTNGEITSCTISSGPSVGGFSGMNSIALR